MGQHLFERGPTIDRHRGKQTALEPAPVLIGTLQIQIGRIIEPRAGDRPARHQAPQHPRPGGARIKPHIHGVGALAPLVGLAGPPGGQQVHLTALPPHIRSMLGHQRLNVAQTGFIQQHLAGLAVIKHRDRHAPGALARDAPIAPVLHHRLDAIATAGGHPAHLLNRRQGLLAKRRHRGEPLLGGTENRRFTGAPVVGIPVLVALFGQQHPRIPQGRDDGAIGILEHIQPGERPRLRRQDAVLIHRTQHRQTVLAPGVEIIDAMAGGGVHQARARLHRDVIAPHQHRRGAIEQGMAVLDAGQFAALEGHQGLEVQSGGVAQALHQVQGHQQIAGCLLGRPPVAAEGVVQVAVHRHRQVGGQGPGGRGPDGHEYLLAVARRRHPLNAGHAQRCHQGTRQGHHRKRHIDTLGGVAIGILQLGLRQGRAGTGTPVHRLEAPVDVARRSHPAKHADLGRLVGRIQGQIGLVPLGPDAPALETPLLLVHLLKRPVAGAAAQLQGGEGSPLVSGHGLQNLEFDRQAVAIPSRLEAGLLALEQGMFIDDVLENLVKGVAHMQGPIRIGGAIVQGESWTGIGAA